MGAFMPFFGMLPQMSPNYFQPLQSQFLPLNPMAAISNPFLYYPGTPMSGMPGNMYNPQYSDLPNSMYGNLPNSMYGDLPNPQYSDLPNSQYNNLPNSQYNNLPNSMYSDLLLPNPLGYQYPLYNSSGGLGSQYPLYNFGGGASGYLPYMGGGNMLLPLLLGGSTLSNLFGGGDLSTAALSDIGGGGAGMLLPSLLGGGGGALGSMLGGGSVSSDVGGGIGGALGTALMPGIGSVLGSLGGSLLGGLFGGLFGGGPSPEQVSQAQAGILGSTGNPYLNMLGQFEQQYATGGNNVISNPAFAGRVDAVGDLLTWLTGSPLPGWQAMGTTGRIALPGGQGFVNGIASPAQMEAGLGPSPNLPLSVISQIMPGMEQNIMNNPNLLAYKSQLDALIPNFASGSTGLLAGA
jgi:hypothetical protein